jgi:uncharacterized cupredoxin-like copper-binding protein
MRRASLAEDREDMRDPIPPHAPYNGLDPTASGRRLRMMKGRLALATLALILALILAGCGGGGSGSGGSSGGGSSSSVKATTGGSSGYGGGNTSSSSAATTTTSSSSGGVLETIVIKETEFKLSPSTVTLSKPGTYAFKAENKGSIEHNLEIDGQAVKSKGGEVGRAKMEQNLGPGRSGVLTVTFQKPGTYEMYCPVIGHRLAGMKGSVVVK